MLLNNTIVKIVIRVLAIVALLLTLIPSILHFAGKIPSEKVNLWMGIGMVLWFLTGSFWLGRKQHYEE
jgi:hypothetical protein